MSTDTLRAENEELRSRLAAKCDQCNRLILDIDAMRAERDRWRERCEKAERERERND